MIPEQWAGLGPRIVIAMVLCGAAVACTEPVNGPEPPEPLFLEIVEGDGQEVVAPGIIMPSHLYQLADSLKVRVTNRNGEPRTGIMVGWSTSTGHISPATSRTDDSGIASAYWTVRDPAGPGPGIGSFTANAGAANAGNVQFTSHVRAGVVIQSIAFSPDTVHVGSGDESVTLSVHLLDDRSGSGVTHVIAQIYNPSATQLEFQTVREDLELISGTPANGEWRGTLTLPSDAERGDWFLGRLLIGWGCGSMNRVELPRVVLADLNLAHEFHVVGDREVTGSEAGTASALHEPVGSLAQSTC